MNARRSLVASLCLTLSVTLAGCGSSSSSSSSSNPTAPPATSGGAGSSGLTGSYPTPQDQTFQGCPPQGDGGDSILNVRKNRIDMGDWQQATVPSLVSLSYPSDIGKQARANWSSADTQAVAQSEGRPLQVEGYMLLVRHEGTESPNCHDSTARDFHMWLGNAPGSLSARADAMIVEVTPRSRALNNGWQPDSRLLGLTGHHVRISGWLMMDQEHPEQVGKTRGTLWEIHPVMKIEVDQNGTWLDLNDTSLKITGGPANTVDNGTGTTTGGTKKHSTRHRHKKTNG